MANIHAEVFRTLKDGALYFFNIFDYFDNEMIITFSDMGKKRIALSAHFVRLFEDMGMKLAGCLVWDKGDVEGKRSFNAGNSSPFYQSPLNCWEHVLVFEKSATVSKSYNSVHKIRPVIKMVRGRNTYGHTAPFPFELPQVCLEDLEPRGTVLDPFSGSGTTARAAISLGHKCVLIELDAEYAKLGDDLTSSYVRDLENSLDSKN
jgi:DNA modification methylase